MDCRILRHVTLKSDGHLGCDDSVGYGINLGHVSLAAGWRLRDTFNGPVYRHVRKAFAEGRMPWEGVCNGCDLFTDGAAPRDTLDHKIELLVEPTLACNIMCACCRRGQIISNGRPVQSLDPAILKRLLASCAADKIAVEQVHYIGWGEPLLHGNFRALLDIVAEAAPQATQVVTTAGNVDYRSTIGDAPMDRIVLSADGSRQAVYEKYRRGGDLDRVVQFMRDCRRYGDASIFLEWKYILFEFNDSDEDILRAQEIADDVGVDSLLFIITNSKWNSQRFPVDRATEFPLRSVRASISPAAAMAAVATESKLLTRFGTMPPGFGHIDKCEISIGKFLTVEGWALDVDGRAAMSVELVLNGQSKSLSRTYLRREDVRATHPVAGLKSGFLFRLPIGDELPESVQVRVEGPAGAGMLGGRTDWSQRQTRHKTRTDMPKPVFRPPPVELGAPVSLGGA